MKITDDSYEAKYDSGKNRLVQELDREKLPLLVDRLKYNPNYMLIEKSWKSSWDEVTKSRLIESLIINIPVPPLVVFEKEYNSYEIIDGKERLKTIIDFYSNRLVLTGLEVETYLERHNYSTLPYKVKERLNRKSLTWINCVPMNSDLSELELENLIVSIKERYA